jgi:hypothetical protein
MFKQFTLQQHESYNVSEIFDIVSKFKSEWLEDTSRQEGTIHHWRTYSYHLTWYPLSWVPGEEYVPSYLCNNKKLWDLIDVIIKDLEIKNDGRVGRATLVNLPANQLVTPHYDKALYTHVIKRFHIPIITNDRTLFSVDDQHVNMKTGECWRVNNKLLHGVYNFGDTDRVHLMIDIIPNELIGDKKYTGDPY